MTDRPQHTSSEFWRSKSVEEIADEQGGARPATSEFFDRLHDAGEELFGTDDEWKAFDDDLKSWREEDRERARNQAQQ